MTEDEKEMQAEKIGLMKKAFVFGVAGGIAVIILLAIIASNTGK